MTLEEGITLPAQAFAAAWQNVLLAASNDDAQPVLYRSIELGIYDSGDVRLTSTDSYMLLTSVVPHLEPVGKSIEVDDLGAAPVETVLITDQDLRGVVVLKWAHKLAERAAKQDLPPLEVRISRRRREMDPDVPTLSPELAGDVLVIDAPDESVALDVVESSFPTWRALFPQPNIDRKATNEVGLNIDLLARFGKLIDCTGATRLSFGGSEGPVLADIDAEPPLLGLVMPMRLPEAS